MGQGTPSVAPDQAKGAVPRPPSLSTPPRSRSAERHGSSSTPRTETPPRSRSEERSDGKGDDRTPTHQRAQTAMSWLDSSRQSSAEPPREAPATSEGLDPIVIGGHDPKPSDPPQEEANRSSSSPGMISRAISALSNMGRGPRPARGRSEERTVAGAPQPPSGDSDGDSSSYGSEVRVHQNPVAQEPRIPASQRPEVPMPPTFREGDAFTAGLQMGMALQAQQDENDRLRARLAARDRPPQEPEPELPGAGEPLSEQPTDATSTELVEDDSEETLDFHETEERSDNPETTDNDPYEQQEEVESETEDPANSQADVRADPDVTQIDIDDSSEEVKESETPEQPSQGEETPRLAAEAATESPPEAVEDKEKVPVPSKPFEFTGSIADWEKLMAIALEQKQGKSPLKESAAKSSEHSPPQASPSETTSTKEDKEQSSKPTQGEGESSSASQAPPAETSAAAASSENPKPASSEQTSSKATSKPSGKFELGKLNRRRKPLQKPRQETEEEKAERERLEKIADEAAKQSAAELIAQEQKERRALTDKEARSKQAAAANTEKAREAAEKAKKQKEAEKAEVPRSVARRMKKAPDKRGWGSTR